MLNLWTWRFSYRWTMLNLWTWRFSYLGSSLNVRPSGVFYWRSLKLRSPVAGISDASTFSSRNSHRLSTLLTTFHSSLLLFRLTKFAPGYPRSEEHTSELQSHSFIS